MLRSPRPHWNHKQPHALRLNLPISGGLFMNELIFWKSKSRYLVHKLNLNLNHLNHDVSIELSKNLFRACIKSVPPKGLFLVLIIFSTWCLHWTWGMCLYYSGFQCISVHNFHVWCLDLPGVTGAAKAESGFVLLLNSLLPNFICLCHIFSSNGRQEQLY